jgi:hydrogenase-1 operon protein HyaE
MPAPIVEALTNRHGFAAVNEETVDAFLAANAHSVLFFPGDSERLVESADVAVILPEILKTFPGVAAAVVEKAAERALQLRYHFNAFPALVFLKPEGYLGAISGVLGWQEYITEIALILARNASEPPPYKFPDRCAPQTQNGTGDERYAGELQ